MKSGVFRVLSLILAVCLALPLLPLAASAAVVTEDGHVIADPDRLEEFVFPGNWADAALRFCVGNGIMNGRGDDLAANEKTTRAETAALLVRLLGAKSDAPDLSRFADAEENAWYYAELAAAVEMGIMNGVSSTRLAPDDSITREQVFTLLSRAFGLYPEDPKAYKRFTDSASCSAYARDAVSALAELGILTGYTDGSVKPKQSITRAELAKLLYELFTCICDSPEELPETGRVLYRGSEPIPEGYALNGSLTIGCGWQGEQTLTDVSVSGLLVLRPAPGTGLTMTGCSAGKLSIAGKTAVSGECAADWIAVAGSGSVVEVGGENCAVFADCVIPGDMANLTIEADGVTVELNGRAEGCVINGKNVTILGGGSVGTVVLNASGSDVQVSYETLEENARNNPDRALETVQTLEVWDTVTEDTRLYSGQSLTGQIRALSAGTRLRHYYYRAGEASASVYTEDGTYGWVDINCITIPTETDIDEEPYTDEVMEAFVNQKGYSSSTKYLVWVSLKTQTVNVFTGGKGNWTLTKSMPCASGKNSTPTVTGEFTVKSHAWEWNFGTYKVRHVTVFYEGYAFHSRIYKTDYSALLDDTIGTPASDGCLRMLDDDCYYIFDQIPTGTRVVVY